MSISKSFGYLLVGACTSLMVISTPTPNYAQGKSVCSFITSSINVRSGPGTNYKTIASLKRGDVVRASHKQGNWVKLTGLVSGTGKKEKVSKFSGWVSNRYINGCSEDKFEMWRR